MSVTRNGVGRLITTPYGEARINAEGRVLWAEWNVWCHAEEMVANGLWTSATSPHRNRQRTIFHVVSASDRLVAARPGATVAGTEPGTSPDGSGNEGP